MPILKIERIHCRKRSETSGSDDEIYLRINGEKVWPGAKYREIQEGKEVQVNYERPYQEDLTVELMEYDPGSADDLLGSITVNKHSLGSSVARANGDGGSYDIHFVVKP